MKFSFNQTTLQETLKQRNLILWCCGGLTLTNLLLVIKLINAQEHWVLIPQADIDHRLEMTTTYQSDDYFIDWANGVVSTVLNVNSDSIDWKVQQILKISVQSYGALKERLKKEAEIIKKDRISTVFYPKKFTVNRDQKNILVTGQHVAYFGTDSVPVITEKTYRVEWDVRARGIILLKDFQEMKNE
ncbi:TraE/TraK family type IV conjugative transfer system protein [Candidatus Odyssella thessalonicensis]|uniref:TraE/TraK family type IV conjugative transfer system protein n=1 Tax=Candidatus Odyssella thessalonicensis TaxID=84647 RepID=UPI000225B964|nr:TraE/TraK family type IV conjugative transfer system protein [Candidatus Odyssella thessalonicensis]